MSIPFRLSRLTLALLLTSNAPVAAEVPLVPDPHEAWQRLAERSPEIADRFFGRVHYGNLVEKAERVAVDESDPEVAGFARLWLQWNVPRAILEHVEDVAPEGGGHYYLARDHMPLWLLAAAFFESATDILAGSRGLDPRDQLLSALGIEADSEQEAALVAAVLVARAGQPDVEEREARRRQIRRFLDSDRGWAYRLVSRGHLEADARALGRAYGRLAAGMGGLESAIMANVRAYLERFRTGATSHRSFEDEAHPVWACERAFQEGMAAEALAVTWSSGSAGGRR